MNNTVMERVETLSRIGAYGNFCACMDVMTEEYFAQHPLSRAQIAKVAAVINTLPSTGRSALQSWFGLLDGIKLANDEEAGARRYGITSKEYFDRTYRAWKQMVDGAWRQKALLWAVGLLSAEEQKRLEWQLHDRRWIEFHEPHLQPEQTKQLLAILHDPNPPLIIRKEVKTETLPA